MRVSVVQGDLLDQKTEAIVNSWNRNIIPWWLLIPTGVSGAIKRRAGSEPFREVGQRGPIALGDAVATGAGKLPYKAIIHVAGINMLWRASAFSIGQSVKSAMVVAARLNVASIAFPVIGAGAGSFGVEGAARIMLDAFAEIESDIEAVLVRFGNQ